MTTDLALNRADNTNVVDSLTNWVWQPYLEPIHYWPYPYPAGTERVVVYVNGHRGCSCPKCDGSCCDCADCKVKRLERRVAELEKERD